jgi:predicted XRE-type DNA-binding protein
MADFRRTGKLRTDLGLPDADVELAKVEMSTRICRLLEHRQMAPDDAAALLGVPRAELPDLLRGRMATCTLDQLARMLLGLGDDVDVLIRPGGTKPQRGALRVFHAMTPDRNAELPIRARASRGMTSSSGTSPTSQDASPARSQRRAEDTDLVDKHTL